MSIFGASHVARAAKLVSFSSVKEHFRTCRQAPGLVSCKQHVFNYQMRSRGNEKINSPLCPRCVTVNPYGYSRVLWKNMLQREKKNEVKYFCRFPQTKGCLFNNQPSIFTHLSYFNCGVTIYSYQKLHTMRVN